MIDGITKNDIGDMHYGNYLYFSSSKIDYVENGVKKIKKESVICITHEGSCFIENYNYSRFKEFFYWVFGVSAFMAAIFSILMVLKN